MADYNVDTLEDKIIVEANAAINSLDKLVGNVKELKKSINEIKSANGIKSINDESKKAKKNIAELGQIWGTFKQALNISGLIYGFKKLFDITSATNKNSIAYIETLNLFEVSMGKTVDEFGNLDSASSKYYTKALDFQNRLHDAFGTNMEETMRYQALYNQMAESMGIGDNASYIMSENLTKLGIDLASLFNKDESATMEALRSGVLAGQTKPLRNYGMDVTQATLQTYANDLGLDRSVSQLSQAEKMILRYIAVLKQSSSAHGDFAKTLESPSNQIKIFKQQLEELKTSIGNLFQGLLGQILPVVNGIIMAIKEVINAIGVLFGFELKSTSKNLVDQSGIDDLNDGLSTAVGSAKALKNELFSWDEIHNIDNGSSSGGGGSIGLSTSAIDSKLLDALGEYDNLMGKVQSKAKDIRDKILDWLGFTGDINHDTQRAKELLDKVETVLKAIGITWLGTKIVGAIGGIISSLGQGGVLGWTSRIQLAVAGIAASWGLAKLSAQNYAKAFKEDDTGALKMGIGEQVGSILMGTATGALIGSKIPVIGTAVGALEGTILASAYTIYEGATSAEKEYIEELKKSMDSSYNDFKISAKQVQGPNNSRTMEDYNNYTQTYKDIWDNDDLSNKTREEVAKLIETYRNLAIAEAQLFDNGGQSIENYYNKYKILVDEIMGSSNTWEGLYNSYISNNDALSTASDSLDVFLTKLGNSTYKTTAEDISKLNEILNEMSSYVKASGDAFVDAAISSTNSLKEEKYISTETADAVVANAIRKANAEGEAFEAYKLQIKDYTTQLQKGIISQDEYNVKIAEAKAEYEKAKSGADSASTAIEFLNEQISGKLDLKDWNTAIEYTQQLGNLYTENADKLKTNYDSELKYYNDQITWTQDLLEEKRIAYGEESDEYKEIAKELEALKETRTGVTEQYENDVEKLKETVYKSLTILEQQIIDSGYNIEEDAQGIYKSVQDQLNKIGLDSKIAENLRNGTPSIQEAVNQIKEIINQAQTGKFKIDWDINPNWTNLKNKLQNIKNNISEFAAVPVVGSLFSGLKTGLGNLLNKISGYAEGGFPQIGEIFMANEAGPELVGRIGSRTAVANNNQIVEAVSKGVYDAVLAAMPNGSTTVQLDVRADEGIIVKKAAQGFKEFVTQTGELPFPVPI